MQVTVTYFSDQYYVTVYIPPVIHTCLSALELLASTDQGSNMQYNSGNDNR